MEKDQLKAFERKCIQQEPAYCTAACPFHMDIRGFLKQMTDNHVEAAYKFVEARLPLPEIMARICDHPCESECIRKDIDQAISIGQLEKICVAGRSGQKKRFLPPPKETHAGIWGSGLSSLTVAWDLILKGFRVTLFDRSLPFGGPLRQLKILPEQVLDREIEALEKFGVRFKTAASTRDAFFNHTLFDTLYLGYDTDTPPGPCKGVEYDKNDLPVLTDLTQQTGNPMIFAGGILLEKPPAGKDGYPVDLAAQGRKAASSMDRYMSGVSMMAGREKHGPVSTRLSTDISRVEPEQRTQLTLENPGLENISREAGRCIQCDCSRCIRVCAYIRDFKGFPGQYAREVYNNCAIVMGEHKANRLINSCSLCGLCEKVCPNDFSMADLCLSARQEMVENKKMPASAHEFALDHMAFASGESCWFARNAPGTGTSDHIFFPGCQLSGSAPVQVEKAYEFLQTHLSHATGFVSGCCGAPAWWAGQKNRFEENSRSFKEFWEKAGRPVVVTACTSCAAMLEKILPREKITSLYIQMSKLIQDNPEILCTDMDKKKGCCKKDLPSLPVLHIIDPCTARHAQDIKDAVRNLASHAARRIKELPASGELTECCGYGGLMFNANPEISKTVITERIQQGESDFLAYCAMCRDRLAGAGKKTIHLLDLFWPDTDHPELREDPGFFRRRQTLAMLKEDWLSRIWQEKKPTSKKDTIFIRIPPETRRLLEDAFILESDIVKTIKNYQPHGGYFHSPDNQSLIAYFRPSRVCFWVEFIQNKDQVQVLDAWSHRMEVDANTQYIPGTPVQPLEKKVMCGRCNEPLGNYKNHMAYLGSRFDVALPQCCTCGDVFISPELARGKIAEVEKILEDK